MCQTKPGLRCSSHAVQKVNQQQNAVADLQAQFNAAAPNEKKELAEKLQRAENKMKDELEEFYLTPQGQNEIHEAIRNKMTRGEDTQELYARLTSTREKINHRKNAYQTLERAHLTKGDRDVVDNQMDEFKRSIRNKTTTEKLASIRQQRTEYKRDETSLRNNLTKRINSGLTGDDAEKTLMRNILKTNAMVRQLNREENILNDETIRQQAREAYSSMQYLGSCYGGRSGGC